ncbi:hypothetical protein BJ138DRAFT_1138745 [Hygrophoropsis aurantiaca]|uniref:Uncharacterized protein n=1 Tax=Hygrophoropsis aurantiaca TaxID=72124 RepID=A0ACB7ZRF1_9AGAM|nr:hypothetical protein BJ138DRAFT_1138745 [Hygrophoropsis aurantiaca]
MSGQRQTEFEPDLEHFGATYTHSLFHLTSGYTYGKAFNIFEDMESDPLEYRRTHNSFYPYNDDNEWELAKFLCETMTQADIKRFLQLGSFKNRDPPPSFRTVDQLYGYMDSLPKAPQWRSVELEIRDYKTVNPMHLIYRDGLEVVKHLFANPVFANNMSYDLHVVYDGGNCEYGEWMTGEEAHRIQDQLPTGATIVPIILASDKTPVTPSVYCRCQ